MNVLALGAIFLVGDGEGSTSGRLELGQGRTEGYGFPISRPEGAILHPECLCLPPGGVWLILPMAGIFPYAQEEIECHVYQIRRGLELWGVLDGRALISCGKSQVGQGHGDC